MFVMIILLLLLDIIGSSNNWMYRPWWKNLLMSVFHKTRSSLFRDLQFMKSGHVAEVYIPWNQVMVTEVWISRNVVIWSWLEWSNFMKPRHGYIGLNFTKPGHGNRLLNFMKPFCWLKRSEFIWKQVMVTATCISSNQIMFTNVCVLWNGIMVIERPAFHELDHGY